MCKISIVNLQFSINYYIRKLRKEKTPVAIRVTMVAAIRTPINAESMAFQNFISISAATSEPVQAPVIGSGIPTKSATPKKEYFSILGLFFSAFL